MGELFIAVVMFFPKGLAGIWDDFSPRVIDFFKKLFVKSSNSAVNQTSVEPSTKA